VLNWNILPQRMRQHFTPLYNLVYNKYYIDEIYDFLFIKPTVRLSRLAFKFDLGMIDGTVDNVARTVVILSKIASWIDRYIVDGAVNMTAKVVGLFSLALRRIQTGYIQTYLLIAFFGLVIIIFVKLIGG
jgi:NADH-quinone oxidoreductase subunit L